MATAIPQKREDSASTSGDLAVPILGVRNDADATLTDANGDYGHISIDSTGKVKISGTVAVSGTVTVDSELPAAALLADNTANPTVPGVAAFGMLYDGATWDRMLGNSTDGLLVNLGSNNDVTITSGTVSATQGTSPWVISGTVTANAGTNLNTSLLALESGGNLATIAGAVHAEDAAVADQDKGVGMLAVRTASPSTTTNANGDYEFLQIDSGRLWVSASIDNVAYIDDTSTHVSGSSKGLLIMGVATPTDTSINANDIGAVAMTLDRKLYVSVQDPLPSGTNTIGTVNALGTVAHDGPAASVNPLLIGGYASTSAPSDVSTDGDATKAWFLHNGAQAVAITAASGAVITGDVGNGLDVHVTGVAGTVVVSNAGLTSLDAALRNEDTASANLDVGMNILAVRKAIPANTSSADGDYESLQMNSGRLWVDASGSLLTASITDSNGQRATVTQSGALKVDTSLDISTLLDRDTYLRYASGLNGIPQMAGSYSNIKSSEWSFTTAQTDLALTTPPMGQKIIITRLSAVTSAATTVNVATRIGFGTTTLPSTATTEVQGMVLSHGAIAPGSGVIEGNGAGVIAAGTDGQPLRLTCGAATSGSLRIVATYYFASSNY